VADPVCDLVVLGSGIAGLSAAVRARREGMSVVVLTKGELGWSATPLANTFQWPGGVSELGPSAQNSASTRAKSPRLTMLAA